MRKYVCSFVVCVLFAGSAYSATIGKRDIGEIRVGVDGVRVESAGAVFDNPDNCGQSDAVFLEKETDYFREMYSALLSAKMSDQPVAFNAMGCVDKQGGSTYPNVKFLYIY